MSTSLWGKFFIQTQSKLCQSEGKAKRKVTANPDVERRKLLKTLKRLDRDMKALEYILDSENQKRHRTDKAIKKAWGYAFAMKGLIYDALKYYQPTLMVFHFNGRRKEINPTWTKRSRLVYAACKHAQAVNALDHAQEKVKE